jgi:uncharacterized protein YqeY
MSLKSQVEAEMKTAMKAKDSVTLTALRNIKAKLLLAETEKSKDEHLSEQEEIQILTKMAKQLRDSLAVYEQQNRADLAENEKAELAVVEKFLPKMMDGEELESALRALIEKLGITSAKEIGKVMGAATKEFAGKADNKAVADTVKKLLA